MPVKCVIITAEPITDIDTTAAEMLHELVDDLTARGIELRFAELKGTVHDHLDRYQVFDEGTPDHSARTIGRGREAVPRRPPDVTGWTGRIADRRDRRGGRSRSGRPRPVGSRP